MPTPREYRDALRRARQLEGRLSLQQFRLWERHIDGYLSSLAEISVRPGAPVSRLEAALDAIRFQERRLREETLAEFARGRSLTADRTIALYEAANARMLERLGAGTALGLRALPTSLLTAYENIGGAGNWRTLLSRHMEDTVEEANAVMRAGIIEGIGPDELARRLRRYVKGSEGFEELFESQTIAGVEVEKLDLRGLSRAQRGAAAKMVHNARRIAFSETHNVLSIAEVAHFTRDPLIKAVRWTLSPDRGTGGPDECDVLASSDVYGLGSGVYPLDGVPPPPHPFDRCETIPLTRPTSEAQRPKPSVRNLRADPSGITTPRAIPNDRRDKIAALARDAINAGRLDTRRTA